MKTPIFYLHTISWLLVTFSMRGAEQTGNVSEIPAKLVAESVAWQVHWDGRAGVTSKAPSTLTFKIHDQSGAWISGLDWIISFANWDGQPLPNFVQRLPASGEVRQTAMLPFESLTKMTAKLPAYTNSFRKISTLKPDIQQKLLNAFKHEACSAEMLAYYKDDTGQPVKKVRFWIAPVDVDFPVMLYFVEGVPYIGKVYFHTHSLKSLHSEYNYIGDQDNETHGQGLRLMSGIKAEGDLFELEDGHLVPVTR
jgi:hypothetical protein